MEISHTLRGTARSVLSPDGTFISTLNAPRLHIRTTAILDIVRTISVPADFNSRTTLLRWPRLIAPDQRCRRILLSDDDNARVWDLEDEKWSATINNGSGGAGKIVNAEFGRTDDEVMLWSDFGSRLTVWSLSTGRSVEIKDPKFSTKGFGFRPRTGIFTLLSRPGPQDIVTLHAPRSHAVLKNITLPTGDAQGLKWSPDGRWFAIWDTPSAGYKVYIYTADGHLFRSYSGHVTDDVAGLGVKGIEWGPHSEYLAIAGFDRRVTLLSTRTFSPSVYLDHTSTVQLDGDVWQEAVTASGERTYTRLPQPAEPPTSSPSKEALLKIGISATTFNADGTLVATKDEAMPTTIWLWDLTSMTPRSIFVQHSPIKQLLWHPTIPNLLLIQCAQEEPVVYTWHAVDTTPRALKISLEKYTASKLEARWLSSPPHRKPLLLFGDTQSSVLAWPYGRDTEPLPDITEVEEENTPQAENVDDTDDSLYEILTGKKSGAYAETVELMEDMEDDEATRLEDTFRGKGALASFEDSTDCFF